MAFSEGPLRDHSNSDFLQLLPCPQPFVLGNLFQRHSVCWNALSFLTIFFRGISHGSQPALPPVWTTPRPWETLMQSLPQQSSDSLSLSLQSCELAISHTLSLVDQSQTLGHWLLSLLQGTHWTFSCSFFSLMLRYRAGPQEKLSEKYNWAQNLFLSVLSKCHWTKSFFSPLFLRLYFPWAGHYRDPLHM